MGCLHVGAGAVATSSTAKRRWRQGDRDQHHIIDPRTGMPADTSWTSVTVYAPDALQAEVLAKSLLIAAPQEAMALAQRYPQTAFIAVDQEGQLWASDHYQEFFYVGQ
jgi:thiamine biosynthesis lipoprotein